MEEARRGELVYVWYHTILAKIIFYGRYVHESYLSRFEVLHHFLTRCPNQGSPEPQPQQHDDMLLTTCSLI